MPDGTEQAPAPPAARGRWRISPDVVVALAFALPVLLVRSPPMVDFAGHEAVVGVLRHWGDPAYFTGSVYRLNLGHPNQLQYLIAWPLSYLLGPAKGLEASVAIGIVSILVGAGRLAVHLRRPRWVALYAAPVALGFFFQWGNIANLLGTGALLFALPPLDRYARDPRPRAIPMTFAWCVVLYLAHEVALVVACVALVCFALRAFEVRRAIFCAIPCAFALLLVVVQLRIQQLSPMNTGFMLVDRGALSRVLGVPQVIVGYPPDALVLWLLFALASLPLLVARFAPAPLQPGRESGPRPSVWPYAVLAGLLVLAYFTLPISYGGVFYFSHRFLPIGWVLLVVIAFRPDADYPRAHRFAAYAVPCAFAATTFPSFLACDASYRELDSLLDAVAPGSAVATIELDPTRQGAFNPEGFSTRMAQGHILAQRGGRALFDYTQSPISPALLRPEKRWDQMIIATFLDPVSIYPAPAFTHFRYLVLHTAAVDVREASVHVLGDVARVAASSPTWVIFESKRPLVAADGPEGGYPPPQGDSLRERLIMAFSGPPPQAAQAPKP